MIDKTVTLLKNNYYFECQMRNVRTPSLCLIKFITLKFLDHLIANVILVKNIFLIINNNRTHLNNI